LFHRHGLPIHFSGAGDDFKAVADQRDDGAQYGCGVSIDLARAVYYDKLATNQRIIPAQKDDRVCLYHRQRVSIN
jgi:hypothetical protein